MLPRYVEIAGQRPFVYGELKFDGAAVADVVEKARAWLSSALSKPYEKKPLLRLRLAGTLQKGVAAQRVSAADITKGFEERAIITISRDFDEADLASSVRALHDRQRGKRSADELGMEIIARLLGESGYKGPELRKVLDLLAEGNNDAVIAMLDENFRASRGDDKGA
jgi:hypothetical protein